MLAFFSSKRISLYNFYYLYAQIADFTKRVAVIGAKNHKRQRRKKRQSVTANWEKSQTPKSLNAILTLPNLT